MSEGAHLLNSEQIILKVMNMKKKLAVLLMTFLFWATNMFAQTAIDSLINAKVSPLADMVEQTVQYPIYMQFFGMEEAVAFPIVLLILILGGLGFSLYFLFPNIRWFGTAVSVVRGKYDYVNEEKEGLPPVEGEVSAFQALSTALSATVGLGNIAGIAIAISVGGPGATFWMIVAGFLGMASKFTECTLGVRFREIDKNGKVYGGPLYYLRKGLREKGFAKLGLGFAWVYAWIMIFASLTAGSMFQINQATEQVVPIISNLMGIQSNSIGFFFGLTIAIIVAIVIIGGIKRIGKVAETVVPLMVGIYVVAGLFILIANYDQLVPAFQTIAQEAFSPTAVQGGILGIMVVGFTRAAFSNEAGLGSAAFAHSAVRTRYAASEGMVALLEPFIDTIVVCTMTALVIIVTDTECQAGSGIQCTSEAFESVLPNFSLILGVAALLFAFSTMLAWSYYGLQAWKYLFGRQLLTENIYKMLFCIFIVLGAASSLGAVRRLADSMMLALVIPNMLGLVFLAPLVKEEVQKYLKAIRQES